MQKKKKIKQPEFLQTPWYRDSKVSTEENKDGSFTITVTTPDNAWDVINKEKLSFMLCTTLNPEYKKPKEKPIIRPEITDEAHEFVYLFGRQKSRGSFDDFYSIEKYDNLKSAYKANDYVIADYVKDKEGIIYIRLCNVKDLNKRLYYRLQYQNCFAGIDCIDDSNAYEMAKQLF